MSFRNIKSGFAAAFFYLLCEQTAGANTSFEGLLDKAQTLKLSSSPVWSALLHSEDKKINITDENFLLSLPNFSLEKELELTLRFLYENDAEKICRFPARYWWLSAQLGISKFDLNNCPEIKEFSEKVPVNEISLVFASENIAQPASMLGHSFLKLAGYNSNKQKISHAISFYTDADSLNFPKLFYESMVKGKKGYFTLTPYFEVEQFYVNEEQRSLWEYQLTLNDFEKQLLTFHLLELKNTQLTYFFQKYNCASLINFLLKLSGKNIINDTSWWITPKQVLKNAQQLGLIADIKVITPSRWLIRRMDSQVSEKRKKEIASAVKTGQADSLVFQDSEQDFLELKLTRAYNQYSYANKNIEKALWLSNENFLEKQEESFKDKGLVTNENNNPLNAPGENQIGLSIYQQDQERGLKLSILPISHQLIDDNKVYSHETSLELFGLDIKIPTNQNNIKIERFALYSIQSLMPRDPLTGGWSGKFFIGAEPHKDKQLNTYSAWGVNGALGITERFFHDVDVYALVGAGLANAKPGTYVYSNFEAGTVIRLLGGFKTLLAFNAYYGQIEGAASYYSWRWNQSKYLGRSYSLNFDWTRDFNQTAQSHTAVLSVKKIF